MKKLDLNIVYLLKLQLSEWTIGDIVKKRGKDTDNISKMSKEETSKAYKQQRIEGIGQQSRKRLELFKY